jgi:hypothetical protein
MTTIQVLDPAGQVHKLAAIPCNPVTSLEGRRLAILDNGKPNFQRLVSQVADKLRDDCSLASVTYFRKENPTVGAIPALLDQIAQSADLVLTGSAD